MAVARTYRPRVASVLPMPLPDRVLANRDQDNREYMPSTITVDLIECFFILPPCVLVKVLPVWERFILKNHKQMFFLPPRNLDIVLSMC